MDKGLQTYWRKIRRQWQLLRYLNVLSVSALLFAITIGTIALFGEDIPATFYALALCMAVFISLIWTPNLVVKDEEIVSLLNRQFPQLEYSAHLFIKSTLNTMEQWQLERASSQKPKVKEVQFPERTRYHIGLLLFSVIWLAIGFWSPGLPSSKNQTTNRVEDASVKEKVVVQAGDSSEYDNALPAISIWVQPPGYTQLASFYWQKEKEVPQGSAVTVSHESPEINTYIVQNTVDTVVFKTGSEQAYYHFKLEQNTLLQAQFKQHDSLYYSEIWELQSILDKSPMLQVDLEKNRVEIPFAAVNNPFKVPISLTDDYGIDSANVIATLSRGEGESVKFREMKIPLNGVQVGRKEQNIDYTIDFKAFEMEPGDELYFYVSAFDNKQPVPQEGKTDVYFFAIEDTTESTAFEFEGLAMDIMPEYFKSQRQIIIDTEKLIKAKQQGINSTEFEEKSNQLGIDQKVLRLRYGAFLGEEFETTAGLGAIDHSGHDHGHMEEEDEHDEEHEVNPEDINGHEHGNENREDVPSFQQNIMDSPLMEQYVHSHEDSEVSTFFNAEVKAKLKEALANMWEAELFLRTYKPQEALPFEYKALKLIKEVQRSSRIYVERIGFEPPPIDISQKRLTGEKQAISPDDFSQQNEQVSPADQLRQILKSLNEVILKGSASVNLELELTRLSNIVIQEMMNAPVRYTSLLQAIGQYRESKSIESLEAIRLGVIKILPGLEKELNNTDQIDLKLFEVFRQEQQKANE